MAEKKTEKELTPEQKANASTGGVFSGLASMLGGQLLGPSLTNPNYSDAVTTLSRAQDALASTPIPTADQLQIVVKNYVNQGILTPAEASAILSDPSKLNDIITNPNLTDSQYQALGNLMNIANTGGISPIMASQLAEIQARNAAQARGANETVMQQAQERGMGNSGNTLLGQLVNNQGSALNNYTQGLGVAAQGQQNALNALTQGGNLATTMQTNQFDQAAQQAAAQDAINKFNAANKTDISKTNAAAANAANLTNITNKNTAANLSTQAQNQAAIANAAIPQTIFQNTLAKNKLGVDAAKNTAEAQTNLGNAQVGASGNLKNSLGGLFGDTTDDTSVSNLIGKGINAGIDYFSDKNLKTNVKEDKFDMDEFLNSVTGYKYQYKPKAVNLGMPSGEQHGVMAQDLEKTPVGKPLVENTPDGKKVDYNKAGPVMMAALANLNGRLKNIERK